MASKKKQDLEEEAKITKLGHHTAGVATNILISKVASVIIAGLAFVVVSRYLGPTVYGIYVLASAFAGVFISFGALGVSYSLPKFIAEYRAKKQEDKIEEVVASGIIAIIALGVVLTLIAIAFVGPISQLVFKSSSYYAIAAVAAITITFSTLYDASYAMLVGFGRKGFLVKLTLIQIATQAGVSIVLIFLHFGAFGPVIGVIAGFIVGSLVAIRSIYHGEKLKLKMPKSESMRLLLLFSLPIAAYNIVAGVVTNLTSLILGYYSNKTIVGNVGAALKFGGVISVVVDSVGVALLPLFASLTDKHKVMYTNKLYNYSITLMLALVLPIICVACVVSWNITVIIWPSWTLLPYLIPIVSVGVIFNMLQSYTSIILITRDKVVQLMKYSILVSLVQLVLMFAVAPRFGGIGIAIVAALVAPFLYFIVYLWLAMRLVEIKWEQGKALRIIAASLVTALVIAPLTLVFASSSITVIVLAAICLVVLYPPLISKFKGIEQKDLERIKTMAPQLPLVGIVLGTLADYAMFHLA